MKNSQLYTWFHTKFLKLLELGVNRISQFRTVVEHDFVKCWKLLPSALCSRNSQNVKLRLAFVEIWSFYRYSDFTWNQILVNSNGSNILFLAILEVLNFDFSKFEQLPSPKFTKIQSSEFPKLPKMTFLYSLNSPKL